MLNVMKNYAIAILIILCYHLSVSAKINNGFLYEKFKLEKEIEHLYKLLYEAENGKTFKQLEKKVKGLQKRYEKVYNYFLETEQLISDIKSIDSELFELVSNVTNSEGTITQVFIKYVDRSSKECKDLGGTHFTASGYTVVGQWKTNKNICTSVYGANTISIIIVKGCDAPFALAHEFAHVLYMVPHLNSYLSFLKNTSMIEKFNSGHSPYDPSYAFIKSVESSFKNKHKAFKKHLKNIKV